MTSRPWKLVLLLYSHAMCVFFNPEMTMKWFFKWECQTSSLRLKHRTEGKDALSRETRDASRATGLGGTRRARDPQTRRPTGGRGPAWTREAAAHLPLRISASGRKGTWLGVPGPRGAARGTHPCAGTGPGPSCAPGMTRRWPRARHAGSWIRTPDAPWKATCEWVTGTSRGRRALKGTRWALPAAGSRCSRFLSTLWTTYAQVPVFSHFLHKRFHTINAALKFFDILTSLHFGISCLPVALEQGPSCGRAVTS